MRVWCSFDFCARGTNVNLCNRSITPENLGIFPYRWDRYFVSSRPSADQSLPCFASKDKYTHTHTRTHIRFCRSFVFPNSPRNLLFDSFSSSNLEEIRSFSSLVIFAAKLTYILRVVTFIIRVFSFSYVLVMYNVYNLYISPRIYKPLNPPSPTPLFLSDVPVDRKLYTLLLCR